MAEIFQEEIKAEIERLLETSLKEMDFEAFETAARRKVLQLAARMIERNLNSDHSDYKGAKQPCMRCGSQAEYAGRKEKVFRTVLGDLKLKRAYYRCSDCTGGFFPRDKMFCMQGSFLSPGVRRMVATVGAMVSFAESSELLWELAGVEVESKHVERTAEAIGGEIAEDERRVVASEQREVAPTMYLGIDGTGVPMRAEELQGRAGKQPDGSAKTREVKLVTVWSAEGRDTEGKPVRDKGSVTYSAAIESAQMIDTQQALSEFALRVQRESERRSFETAERQIILGDAASWIWKIAGELFPKAIQVVDRFHAKEHLSEVCKIIWGPESQIGKEWLNERHAELDLGEIKKIIAALSRHKRFPEVKRCIKYLKENQHRMRYNDFHQQQICTSSGVLEAGCKLAIGTRLKRAGMHWTLRGSNAIIALRCCKLSGRFEDFWERKSQKSMAA